MSKSPEFLRPYQIEAVNRMKNGCILNGGVGSGKSRTGIYYYFKEQGGSYVNGKYIPMKRRPKPKDLYIITTAMKRDSLEWHEELVPFLLSVNEKDNTYYKNKVVIDSWNNIKKYRTVTDAFFILDEDRITGSGVWVKSFLRIARHNDWIVLSATPGDDWSQYIPVFVANKFYKNKTEFIQEHVVYSRFCKYPKIDKYVNTKKLIQFRNDILIDMDFKRNTVRHNENIFCSYDIPKYREAKKKRWDPFKNEPIQQASGLCYVLRKIVNSDESRQIKFLELLEEHPKVIVFYNFDYELDILKEVCNGNNIKFTEWNGHKHEAMPTSNNKISHDNRSERWVYLVQYTSGCEGWNCVTTDTIIFYSQNYSYKVVEQASGRIDRMNTPFKDLYYYHLKTKADIDLAINKALVDKKRFNEGKFSGF